eukprot:491792-Prorocentrum_minimum.AAC.1
MISMSEGPLGVLYSTCLSTNVQNRRYQPARGGLRGGPPTHSAPVAAHWGGPKWGGTVMTTRAGGPPRWAAHIPRSTAAETSSGRSGRPREGHATAAPPPSTATTCVGGRGRVRGESEGKCRSSVASLASLGTETIK